MDEIPYVQCFMALCLSKELQKKYGLKYIQLSSPGNKIMLPVWEEPPEDPSELPLPWGFGTGSQPSATPASPSPPDPKSLLDPLRVYSPTHLNHLHLT